MKSMLLGVLASACLGLGASVFVPAEGASPDDTSNARLLVEHEISRYGAARAPLEGAPGASAIGFTVNRTVQGGMLVVGLDQPVLGVFVGLNAPNEHINAPDQDLFVNFTLVDGATRIVTASGGGGAALLFQSPDDVPLSSLSKVALYVANTAEWAKERDADDETR